MEKVQISGAADGWMIQSDGSCYSARGKKLLVSPDGKVSIKTTNGQMRAVLVSDLLNRNFKQKMETEYMEQNNNNMLLKDATLEQLTAEIERRRHDSTADKVVQEIVDTLEIHCARSNLDHDVVVNKLIAKLQ